MFNNLKWYIKNRIRFNKVLWDFRPYDSTYTVDLFKFGLSELLKGLQNSTEQPERLEKKKEAIKELISLIDKDVVQEAIDKYGVKELDKIEKKITANEKKRMNRIFKIIKGNNSSTFVDVENYFSEPTLTTVDEFDGTGIDTWWC